MSHFVPADAVVVGGLEVADVARVRLLASVGPHVQLEARLGRG
jgi:hypothetical protein